MTGTEGDTVDAVEHYRKALDFAGQAERAFHAPRSYEGGDVPREVCRAEDVAVATEAAALAGLASVHMDAARLMFDVDGRTSFMDPAESARWDTVRTASPEVDR